MCMFVLEIIIHMMLFFATIYCKEAPSVMGIKDFKIRKPKKKKKNSQRGHPSLLLSFMIMCFAKM